MLTLFLFLNNAEVGSLEIWNDRERGGLSGLYTSWYAASVVTQKFAESCLE